MDKQLPASFHALGDPTRLAVVEALLKAPASVSELARPHSMALPAFMKHLKVLEQSVLIVSEKTGRVRTCRIKRDSMAVIDRWFLDRRKLWTARLDRLGEIIDEKPQE